MSYHRPILCEDCAKFCPCDEVYDLRAEIERLRSALKPFADYADRRDNMPADMPISNGSPLAKRQLTMGDCYAARRALEGK